jgi:bifunctional N-acetylglucosamine-1-phosphate-uridyltransferase/glucosamine-1-phosphate-acetyltransferase GlmU-like protein
MSGIASLIFAAGKGSRMIGYNGNKTLLPLIPGRSRFEGIQPLIREVLDNVPPGPRGIVVGHCADDVRRAVEASGITFIEQPVANGTGGALLAAGDFIRSVDSDYVVITMGDVPLIRSTTYDKLLEMLRTCDMALLAFEPEQRAQYGMLEMEGARVARIVEWKYWSKFPMERQQKLRYCNAGVYAARRQILLRYMENLENRAHEVHKERDGQWITIREYFLTDLAEMMHGDGLTVGMAGVSEDEVTGVDTPESLEAVQKIYAEKFRLSVV